MYIYVLCKLYLQSVNRCLVRLTDLVELLCLCIFNQRFENVIVAQEIFTDHPNRATLKIEFASMLASTVG